MKMDIHYITAAGKETVLVHLKECYSDNVNFIPLSSEEGTEWSVVYYLLIIEPVKIGREYYSLSKLWKNWLYQHAPHVKLFLATYSNAVHANALNLLDLPENIVTFCKYLPAVDEYVPRRQATSRGEKEKFLEPWYIDLPLSGVDAKKDVERFLNGHDHNSSFYSQMVALRNQVINLEHFSKKGEGYAQEDEEMVDKYRNLINRSQANLQNRWHQYEQLMKYLPFSKVVRRLDDNISYLRDFRKSDAWKKDKAIPDVSRVNEIRDMIKDGLSRYVFPEDY